MSLNVKAEYKKQIRRFLIESDIPFLDFYQALSNIFQEVLVPTQISIKYMDDEEDWVTIVKEEEWQEALRVCANMQTLRVAIDERKRKPTIEMVIEEVENVINGMVQETGKVFNKKAFEDAYQSVKTTLEEKKMHEQINNVLEKCSTTIENIVSEVDKGVKTVIDHINPRIQEISPIFQTIEHQILPMGEQEMDDTKPMEAVPVQNEAFQPRVRPAGVAPTQQPNMEQSWTFIEVNSEPVPTVVRQPPNSRFIRDVTYEDHSEVDCGEVFNKQWELQNTSNSVWPEGVRVEFVQGSDDMMVIADPVPRAQPLEKVIVSVQLRAPESSGNYKSIFRLSDGKDHFGASFWCEIKAVKKIPKKWSAELTLLQEMGFSNVEKNIKLLEENRGDLSSVIQVHLNSI